MSFLENLTKNQWVGRFLGVFVLTTWIFTVAVMEVVATENTAILVISKMWPLFFGSVLPSLVLGLAVSVILLPNLVHSLLALIGVFLTMVVVFIGFGAEYLAFVFTIVYVGAVSILFLFVVMLINIRKNSPSYRHFSIGHRITSLVLLALSSLLVTRFSFLIDNFVISADLAFSAAERTTVGTVSAFVKQQFFDILYVSEHLYSEFSFLFFLISLVLLIAMLGAIVLASRTMDAHKNG